MYPTDWRYSKDHEWVRPDGDTVRIGITDFAQQELGDIVYVEVPEAGTEVKAGDTLGTIESVKAVSEIFAPVSGTVVSVNEALDEYPRPKIEVPDQKEDGRKNDEEERKPPAPAAGRDGAKSKDEG